MGMGALPPIRMCPRDHEIILVGMGALPPIPLTRHKRHEAFVQEFGVADRVCCDGAEAVAVPVAGVVLDIGADVQQLIMA